MALTKSKTALVTLRGLLSEIRKESSSKVLKENQMARYVLEQYRKYQTTDQQLCKAIDEMHFRARTYYNYLYSARMSKEINKEYKGRGERSVEDTARLVGFKLPHDPKPK